LLVGRAGGASTRNDLLMRHGWGTVLPHRCQLWRVRSRPHLPRQGRIRDVLPVWRGAAVLLSQQRRRRRGLPRAAPVRPHQLHGEKRLRSAGRSLLRWQRLSDRGRLRFAYAHLRVKQRSWPSTTLPGNREPAATGLSVRRLDGRMGWLGQGTLRSVTPSSLPTFGPLGAAVTALGAWRSRPRVPGRDARIVGAGSVGWRGGVLEGCAPSVALR
jgi:hypothetical protein